MSKTPTAEEVLGLYLKWNKTEEEFDEFRMQCRDEGEVHDFAMDVINDKEKFEATLCEWQSAQGPVTREWFVERFGGELEDCQHCGEWVRVRRGHVSVTWIDGDVVLGLEDPYDDLHFAHRKMINPTRADIERFVLVMGGPELT